jgi:two-component system, chemotaxis family, protein-glutamate methylesterase/glutaminase
MEVVSRSVGHFLWYGSSLCVIEPQDDGSRMRRISQRLLFMSIAWASRSPVRVLVVDDSAFMRTALSRMINSEAEFEVIGTAGSGSEALAKIPTLNPGLITLDLEMPGLDGLETLRRIMHQFPRPVIIVSGTGEHDCDAAITALGLGAFDYVPKRLASTTLEIVHIREDLISKLRVAAESMSPASEANSRKPPVDSSAETRKFVDPAEIVAIGASTGGPRALQQILSTLPANLTVPVLVVQHLPPGFIGPLTSRLNELCAIPVCRAVHLAGIESGVVYLAPAGMHMTLQRLSESKTCIWLDSEPSNHVYVPSIDITMQSVAEVYGNRAMGVILSGMGRDGAEGIKAIHARGGMTIGQDQATSLVYSMPRSCVELGILDRILPISEIGAAIVDASPRARGQSVSL